MSGGGAQWGVPRPQPLLDATPSTADLSIVDCQEQDDRFDHFDVYFYDVKIKTMLTSDPTMVTHWVKETESSFEHRLVGLDVEWRPSFNRNQQNPIAILQLCVNHRCLIFQLLYCSSVPASLVSFLANRDYIFVGVGIQNDAEKLEEDHQLRVGNVVDLTRLATDVYGTGNNAGLKELSSVVLGREIEKPRYVTMGKWDSEWLNLDQVKYACLDAFVSFEIGRLLNARG